MNYSAEQLIIDYKKLKAMKLPHGFMVNEITDMGYFDLDSECQRLHSYTVTKFYYDITFNEDSSEYEIRFYFNNFCPSYASIKVIDESSMVGAISTSVLEMKKTLSGYKKYLDFNNLTPIEALDTETDEKCKGFCLELIGGKEETMYNSVQIDVSSFMQKPNG